MRNTRRNKATEVNKWRKKYCNLRNVDGLVTPLFDSLVVDVYNVTILTNLMKKKEAMNKGTRRPSTDIPCKRDHLSYGANTAKTYSTKKEHRGNIRLHF